MKLVTPPHHQAYMLDLWKRAQVKMGRWLQGQILLSLIVGVLVYIGLLLLGVPYALLLALVAFILELIPVFGSILAAIPAVMLAFIDSGTAMALFVIILYVIVNQLQGNVIYPMVVQKILRCATACSYSCNYCRSATRWIFRYTYCGSCCCCCARMGKGYSTWKTTTYLSRRRWLGCLSSKHKFKKIMNKKIFVSTSIPYVNARPHIGHALEYVQADAYVRYRRLMGDDVYFTTGTDDNALKNVLKAEEAT